MPRWEQLPSRSGEPYFAPYLQCLNRGPPGRLHLKVSVSRDDLVTGGDTGVIRGLFLVAVVVLFWPERSTSGTGTTTQTLSGQLSPIGKLSVPASLTLTKTAPIFGSYTGTLTLSNRVRTTSTGTAAITVQASSDFAPSGGPSAGSGALTYTCSAASYGTACTGTRTASTVSQTPVVNFSSSACTGGGGGCSGSDPNTVQIDFTLANDTAFKVGTYSAVLTFTASAT